MSPCSHIICPDPGQIPFSLVVQFVGHLPHSLSCASSALPLDSFCTFVFLVSSTLVSFSSSNSVPPRDPTLSAVPLNRGHSLVQTSSVGSRHNQFKSISLKDHFRCKVLKESNFPAQMYHAKTPLSHRQLWPHLLFISTY